MESTLFFLIVTAIFANNFILSQFLGVCAFIGVSKRTDAALGMGLAVIFVMGVTSIITYFIYHYVLDYFSLQYLDIIVFILVIATLVQVIEIIMKRFLPKIYQMLGIYLPLITTNCAILGLAFINIRENYSFIESLVYGLSAGVGFLLALLLMSGIRERLEGANVPKAFSGVPIAFIIAALMSLAFFGLATLIGGK
jgi:Na+-translocating ferredoxin:NAD+ oxidoreductase subunit A